jgi:hypothetical protein
MDPEQTSGGDENLVVPESLTGMTDADLDTLGSELLRTFDAIRSEGKLSGDKVAELRTITAAIERVNTETNRRAAENAQLVAEAASTFRSPRWPAALPTPRWASVRRRRRSSPLPMFRCTPLAVSSRPSRS